MDQNEAMPRAEEFRSERNLSMALIRNPDGSGYYRSRIFCGPTVDYPESEYPCFETFVQYCLENHELRFIEETSFKQHGEPQKPDWKDFRRKAIEWEEAKRKSEEANMLYEKAVERMNAVRKSKWIVPGLIRRPASWGDGDD